MAFRPGQDWEECNIGRKGGQMKPKTAQDKKADMTAAKRVGAVSTETKFGAGGNANAVSSGIMGTTAGAKARKLEDETEVFKTEKVSLSVSKAIQQARTAKGMSQKDLATKLMIPPKNIQELENGKAQPDGALIAKN